MPTLHPYIISLVCFFSLVQCKSAKEDKAVLPATLSSFMPGKQNKFVGEWKYNNTIYYAAKLTINADKTFDYYNYSCSGISFTEGWWTESMGAVILTSGDRYKKFNNAIVTIIPGSNDTSFLYFKNIQLRPQGESLYCDGEKNFMAQQRYRRNQWQSLAGFLPANFY